MRKLVRTPKSAGEVTVSYTDVGDPVNKFEIVNKQYVDAIEPEPGARIHSNYGSYSIDALGTIAINTDLSFNEGGNVANGENIRSPAPFTIRITRIYMAYEKRRQFFNNMDSLYSNDVVLTFYSWNEDTDVQTAIINITIPGRVNGGTVARISVDTSFTLVPTPRITYYWRVQNAGESDPSSVALMFGIDFNIPASEKHTSKVEKDTSIEGISLSERVGDLEELLEKRMNDFEKNVEKSIKEYIETQIKKNKDLAQNKDKRKKKL